ncbi:MAG TPA: SdrD B-like domain-containing protein, partial [Tepidisphaeraceae bacterium]|nr:SdrD B-like domain-containing protein [Tepidisphaeraceae bacterium]
MNTHRRPLYRRILLESLEERALFTAAAIRIPSSDISLAPLATVGTQYQILSPAGSASPNSSAKSSSQIRTAYGVNSISFNGITGDGTGQTIAIIDAFDDPSFVSTGDPNFSISDLARFDTQYGIADPPSFTKINQTGGTSYPTTDSGWDGEISLDVEWAHAIAPAANIILVEANSANFSDLMAAVDYARTISTTSVVTMSFGAAEFSGETSYDFHFTTPSGHTPITFVAATGDTGSPGSYPAFSPNVVALGGTSLYLNTDGTYSSESAWSSSGGGISTQESKPSFQTSVTLSTNHRTTPDLSLVADPHTGVWVLNTGTAGIGSANGWTVYGGTSLSSPLFAALVSIADQGRASLSLSNLASSTVLSRIYAITSSDYHDITTGSNNSYSATTGYDLVTGRGSPITNLLIPDLVGGTTITGTVFKDSNGNGVLDSGEPAISGVLVYIDINNNGIHDSSEPSVTTGSSGTYSFSDLGAHATYLIRESTPSGYVASTPASVSFATPAYGLSATLSFGNYPSFSTSYTGNAFTLRLDSTGTHLEIYTASSASGTPSQTLPINVVTSLSFTGTTASDSFTIDLANGNPLAGTTISYNGGARSDTLHVLGSAGADNVTFSSTSITVGAGSLSISNVEVFTFDGRQGYDNLTLNSFFPLTIAPNQQLNSLTLAASTLATLSVGRNTLYTRSLSISSSAILDLTDGTLIDDDSAGAINSMATLLTTGYDTGIWDGYGIDSSTASANTAQTTALGYLTAADLGVSSYNSFAVSPSAVIIKYTYYGDATLDGNITSDDFALTDRGHAKNLTGWLNGDFNYDGLMTAADYTLLNNAYATLTAPAPTDPASAPFTTTTSSDSPT